MNDIKAEVRDILLQDAVLLEKLAVNNNPWNKDAVATKKNSIVDHLNVDEMVPVFVTIRSDVIALAGQTHLTNAFLLVRCYNERDKSFYTINEVLSRVQKLLNGKRFPVAGYATVETVWETTSAELPDDGLGLNYREAQFRIQLT